MYGFLLLLCGMNFIVYSQQGQQIEKSIGTGNADEQVPSAPLEEKVPGIKYGLAEDFLHDDQHYNLSFINMKGILLNTHSSERLPVVHFELLCPPPNHFS